jgi:WD40 repeat protein
LEVFPVTIYYVPSVAINHDGSRITAGGGDFEGSCDVQAWDTRTKRPLFVHKEKSDLIRNVWISTDGRRIVAGQLGKVRLFDGDQGAILSAISCNMIGDASAITNDGKKLLLAGSENVLVVDTKTGRVDFSLKHPGTVSSLAISRDGSQFTSSAWDQIVRVWKLPKGELLYAWKGHTGPVSSVAISADGTRVVSGSKDKTVKV